MERKVARMMGLWAIGLMILQASDASISVDDISCPEAIAALNPCLSYLKGNDPSPTSPCCMAVQKVNQEATTTQIRRNLCVCFKQAASTFGVDSQRAKQLPDLCHVQVPVPIDPNIDCSKISA